MDIVKLPIADFGEAKVSLAAGKIIIEIDADLLAIAKDVRAKSTNAIENASPCLYASFTRCLARAMKPRRL